MKSDECEERLTLDDDIVTVALTGMNEIHPKNDAGHSHDADDQATEHSSLRIGNNDVNFETAVLFGSIPTRYNT